MKYYVPGIPGIPDQFHALLDLWGGNFKSEKSIPLTGDAVHPGPAGQLTMAYACLTGLNAPALVSKAALDAAGQKVVAAEKCAIKGLKVEGDTISFERADECLPMPIPASARPALRLAPITEKLNQYTLTIAGLKGAAYDISIDDTKVATVTAQELAEGWNMSELTAGPIAAQCRSVLDLIAKKEVAVAGYRDIARFQTPFWLKDLATEIEGTRKAQMEKRMQAVIAAGAGVNAAAQPQPHHFVATPAKP